MTCCRTTKLSVNVKCKMLTHSTAEIRFQSNCSYRKQFCVFAQNTASFLLWFYWIFVCVGQRAVTNETDENGNLDNTVQFI